MRSNPHAGWDIVEGQPMSMEFMEGTHDDFWLQRNQEGIDWLQKQLQNISVETPLPFRSIEVGHLYAAVWAEDECMYRGKVLKMATKSKKLLVRFIDFGNVDTLEGHAIFELPPNLESIPAQAVHCCLRGDARHASSGGKCEELFRNFFRVGKPVKATLHKNTSQTFPSQPDYETEVSLRVDFADILREDLRLEAGLVEEERNKTSCCSSAEDPTKVGGSETKVQTWLASTLEDANDTFLSYDDDDDDDDDEDDNNSEDDFVVEIPTIELDEENGARVECVIEHVESPALFYVHLTDPKYHGAELGKLSASLSQYYMHKKLTWPIQLMDGSFVAVNDPTDGWMRGMIVGSRKDNNGSCYRVFLVDYGDHIEVPEDQLRRLPANFGVLPRFALPCSLLAINPCFGSKVFSPEAVNRLKTCSAQGTHYFIYDPEMPQKIVLLMGSSSVTFNDTLLNEGLASSPSDLAKARQLKNACEVKAWDPMADDFMSPNNVPTRDEGIDGPLNLVYNGKQEQKLCKFYRSTGRCARGRNCRFLHLQTGELFSTSDEATVMTVAHHEIDLPDKGTTVIVHIPVIRHPGNFIVIMSEGLNDTTSSSIGPNLEELGEQMTVHYENTTRKGNTTPHVPGEIVAAQYIGRWYRARIIDDNDADDGLQNVRAFFVDFGHSSDVDVLSIRQIEPHFLHMPFQAVECSLANIKPGPKESGIWPRSVNRKFRELTTNGVPLRATVTANLESRLEVDLYALINEDWINVADELKERNLVVDCHNSIDLSKSLVLPG